MSVKVKQAIINCLSKVENNTFDEDTIRTLLIVAREHFKTDGLIKELAHFIAHTERTQGIFHKKINSRYAKYKLVDEQVATVDIGELSKTIKTEDELSDFMLSGVSVEKIEAKLFNILYLDGLDDLPESHLVKYTDFKKHELKKILEQFYVKKDGYYYMTTNRTENMINAFRSLPLSKYNPEKEVEMAEQLRQAENTAKKVKSTMDGIQKAIRGAIFSNSVFETETFRNEIVTAITQVIDKFRIDRKYIDDIKENCDDILLCIMTLLHDSKFIFFDKNEAKIFLCFYMDYNYEEARKPDYNSDEVLYEKGVIALYILGKRSITFPLFVSDLPIKQYLSYENYKSKPMTSSISETIWTTANRIDKRLQLTNEINNEVSE